MLYYKDLGLLAIFYVDGCAAEVINETKEMTVTPSSHSVESMKRRATS